MKACIYCGDRNWTNVEVIERSIRKEKPDVIIEGEAAGADILSRRVAEDLALGIAVLGFVAEWSKYGRAAGPVRNREMLTRLLAFARAGWEIKVVAFHNDLDRSKGTRNMVEIAEQKHVPVEVITEQD